MSQCGNSLSGACCSACADGLPCSGLSERLGASATLDPRAAQFMDMAADFLPIPDIAKSAIKTTVGVATPVSPEDSAAFAQLVTDWVLIDQALFSPALPGSIKSQAASARKSFDAFQRLWNAAQRDPAALRKQLKAADDILAAIEAAKDGMARTPIRLPTRAPSRARAAGYVALGVGAVVVGGAVALIAGHGKR